MNDYIAPEWQRTLELNGLRSFEDFWNLKADWFEAPNKRRGGWSGVARCELKRPDGTAARVFLKRQENHTTRTLAHPFAGIPTFVREFKSIMLYRRHGIPTLNPVYFAARRQDGGQRAVLITEELVGLRSLEDLARGWRALPKTARREITHAVARLLRQIHSHRLSHNCFYPKHVFLRLEEGRVMETRIIDLEKTKWHPFGVDRKFRDMRRLNGRGFPWSRTERVHFFREYLQVEKLTPGAKEEWRRIAKRHLSRHAAETVLLSPATERAA